MITVYKPLSMGPSEYIFFKQELLDRVNPDLLERLWRKSKSLRPFLYKTPYGVDFIGYKSPYGELWLSH